MQMTEPQLKHITSWAQLAHFMHFMMMLQTTTEKPAAQQKPGLVSIYYNMNQILLSVLDLVSLLCSVISYVYSFISGNLKKIIEGMEGKGKEKADPDDPLVKAQKEVKDLEDIIPDIMAKVWLP